MPASYHLFRFRIGPRCVNDQVGDQVEQVKSVAEPIGEGADVGLGVFAVLPRRSLRRQPRAATHARGWVAGQRCVRSRGADMPAGRAH